RPRNVGPRRPVVAHLAVEVPAPSPEGTVCLERKRVVGGCCDGDPVVIGAGGRCRSDLLGLPAIRRTLVPYLSLAVVPPGPERAVLFERQHVETAGRNGREVGSDDLHGRRAVDVAVVAQGSGAVVPPSL